MYGIKIGNKFYIEGTPKLKIRGRAQDIVIGNGVCIFGTIDLRNRERGRIVIKDEVAIDDNCRIVAANDAVVTIGERTGIGRDCIFNCGASVTVGADCLFAGDVHVQSSEHSFARGRLVREQPHTYSEITIGDDCWLAAGASIMKGAKLGDGCIVGAKALVRAGDYPPNSILVGTPARIVKERI